MMNFKLTKYPLPMMILLNTFFGILFAFKLYDFWYNGGNGYTLILDKNTDRVALIRKRPCRRIYKIEKPLNIFYNVAGSTVKKNFIVLEGKNDVFFKIEVNNQYE